MKFLISDPEGRGINPLLLVRRNECEGGLNSDPVFRDFQSSKIQIADYGHTVLNHMKTFFPS
jgi:hypothetical protein